MSIPTRAHGTVAQRPSGSVNALRVSGAASDSGVGDCEWFGLIELREVVPLAVVAVFVLVDEVKRLLTLACAFSSALTEEEEEKE